MSELRIKVGFDGTALDRGLKQSERTLQQFGSRITQAFGAIGTVAALKQLEQLWEAFEQGNSAAEHLEATLTRMTGSSSAFETAMERLGQVVRQTGRDDGELARSVEMLAVKSNDAAGAVQNLALVLDVAERFGKDLSSATDVVAAAMAGEFRQLSALIPEFKDFTRANEDLAGTSEGAAAAMNKLLEAAGGAAAEKLRTTAGQIERLKGLLDETKESAVGMLARLATDADDTQPAVKRVADELDRIRRAIEGIDLSRFKGLTGFGPETIALLGWEFGRSYRDAGKDELPEGTVSIETAGLRVVNPRPPKPKGGKGGNTGRRADPWWNARGADQPWDFGWMESESDFADQAETYFREFEEAEEKLAKEREEAFERRKEQERELAATLQDGMELVLSGFIDGWDDVTKRAQRMIADRIIAELAKAAAMFGAKLLLTYASGGAAAPIVDSPTVPGGDIFDFSTAGYHGQSVANLQRRTARG